MPSFNIERGCFQDALLGFRHSSFASLIVVQRAEHHHVFGTIVLVFCPLDNVMVLEDRHSAFAAPEAGFLSKLSSDTQQE